MVTECRRDCEFYSSYTSTCDYTLLMYESRGCPTDACTKYRQRSGKCRSWSISRQSPPGAARLDEEVGMRIPEPSDGGMQLERYVTAGCGHEVYEGEFIYDWEDGETLCPECVESKFDELGTPEKAALLGCEGDEVRFSGRF